MKKRTIPTLAMIVVVTLGTAGLGMAQDQGSKVEGYEEPGPGWGRGGHRPLEPGLMGLGLMGPGRPGGGRDGGLRMALRQLDLSESQRSEIRSIFESEREVARASHERMRLLGEELREQIEGDPFNEEAVRTRAAAVAEVGVEMAVVRARQVGQVLTVLTPEQTEELEQIKEHRKAFREERRDRFEQRRQRRSNP